MLINYALTTPLRKIPWTVGKLSAKKTAFGNRGTDTLSDVIYSDCDGRLENPC